MTVNGKKVDFSKYRLITNVGILCLRSLSIDLTGKVVDEMWRIHHVSHVGVVRLCRRHCQVSTQLTLEHGGVVSIALVDLVQSVVVSSGHHSCQLLLLLARTCQLYRHTHLYVCFVLNGDIAGWYQNRQPVRRSYLWYMYSQLTWKSHSPHTHGGTFWPTLTPAQTLYLHESCQNSPNLKFV